MEESGKTIRETTAAAPSPTPRSWLCDDDDRPVVEYLHEDDDTGAFRIRVGAAWYERFRRSNGEWLYRRVR